MNEIATLCRQLSFGVYVVGAAQDERRDAFTAVWVMQASFDPLLLAVSINPQNASYPLVTIQPSTFRAQEKVLDADGRMELQMELLLSPAA